jgi:hypothetical protein
VSEQPGSAPPAEQPPTCPSCGATVRADVPWCTQCYAPLRPEGTVSPGDDLPPADLTGAVDVGDPDSADVRAAGSAEPASGDVDATGAPASRTADPQELERVADQMLAELAGSRDEVRGLAARLPSTPAGRAALVAAVVVAGTALALIVMFVLGSLG